MRRCRRPTQCPIDRARRSAVPTSASACAWIPAARSSVSWGGWIRRRGSTSSRQAAPRLLEAGARIVVLGTGDHSLVAGLQALAARRPDRLAVIDRFDRDEARRIYAGADLFLMPSRFEPSGQGQLIALRYGTIPVVRSTGGLADTIRDADRDPATGNGFAFVPALPEALLEAALRAMAAVRDPVRLAAIQLRGMTEDASWTRPASIRGRLSPGHRPPRRHMSPANRSAPIVRGPALLMVLILAAACASPTSTPAATSTGAGSPSPGSTATGPSPTSEVVASGTPSAIPPAGSPSAELGDPRVAAALATLTTDTVLVDQLLFLGWDGSKPASIRATLASLRPGGIVFAGDNANRASAARAINRAIAADAQALGMPPPFRATTTRAAGSSASTTCPTSAPTRPSPPSIRATWQRASEGPTRRQRSRPWIST